MATRLAANLKQPLALALAYFHPKMWFFDTNVNYYDNSYIDLTPVRKEKSIMAKYDTQEKFSSNVVWDASIGKPNLLQE